MEKTTKIVGTSLGVIALVIAAIFLFAIGGAWYVWTLGVGFLLVAFAGVYKITRKTHA